MRLYNSEPCDEKEKTCLRIGVYPHEGAVEEIELPPRPEDSQLEVKSN